uniref:Protein CHROMATIN REMODELING 8 n=1 Tax=Nicotiana tabacum TaxID=4097 RepID=A0A1S4C0E7_TOBAC|nr:PREDICTED: protein CHROMATIN REMODELING 8-like [Nicotiana tabacum]
MEEEEEDKILLSSLGVTSANPEDIEHDILEKATRHPGESNEATGSAEEEIVERKKGNEEGQDKKLDLYNKLRAVEVEIDAIKSGFGHLERFRRHEEEVPDTDGRSEVKQTESEQSVIQAPLDDSNLQHALADDRLRSLLKTKAQLKKELLDFTDDTSRDALIRDLVKDQPEFKRKVKEVQKSSNKKSKRRKTTLLDDDDDFDAVLTAASSGFVETERDALVRKGMLTPFHQLKGFERRVQDSESFGRQSTAADINSNDNDLASTSIDKAVQSISQAAQARPTTKLLDSASLPKLEAPTHPFQRLRKPLKIPQSLETTPEKNGDGTRKKKRPLPSKKWRKLASREQSQNEGSGIFIHMICAMHLGIWFIR